MQYYPCEKENYNWLYSESKEHYKNFTSTRFWVHITFGCNVGSNVRGNLLPSLFKTLFPAFFTQRYHDDSNEPHI